MLKKSLLPLLIYINYSFFCVFPAQEKKASDGLKCVIHFLYLYRLGWVVCGVGGWWDAKSSQMKCHQTRKVIISPRSYTVPCPKMPTQTSLCHLPFWHSPTYGYLAVPVFVPMHNLWKHRCYRQLFRRGILISVLEITFICTLKTL